MKNLFYLILLSALITTSCSQEDFNIPNTNEPDGAAVLANSNDFQNFNISNHTTLFSEQVGFNAIYFRGLADQFTTTNAYRGFWDYCIQPRIAVNNQTSNDDLGVQAGGPWDGFNSVINNANTVIKNIVLDANEVILSDGSDVTNQELAGAYFDKGLGLGYLSMIYDKAYLVNPDTDVNNLMFSSYTEVLASAVQNIENAITSANAQGSDFEYNLYIDSSPVGLSQFIELANSYLARFSIAVARTDSEAQGLNYVKILEYANKGLSSDFYPLSSENVFFNNFQDWSLYTLGDGAGYMPTDIKIQHLFDPSYPTDYPTDETILPAATSSDPRLTMYYEYVGAKFGFLRESRGRELFSSYRHIRFFNNNDENADGLPVEVFSKAEIDYIKAECYYRMSDYPGAVSALNASPRMTVGGQSTTTAKDNIRNVLLYENSIELDLNAGMATSWAFMRRHDLLQTGTPTMYPIPASELEITQDQIYTFGGATNSGDTGAASGNNDWKNLTLVY